MQNSSGEKYKCIPCGYDCDTLEYDSAGHCPHCSMELVKGSSIHFGSVQPEELCSYISTHPGLVLLDVRTQEEFSGKADPDFGSLQNAINIPVQSLPQRLAELNGYKDMDILVYCSHSHRSPMASYLLTQNGFTKVYNLQGGMSVIKDTTCRQKR